MIADLLIKNIGTLYTLDGPDRPRYLKDMDDIVPIHDGVIACKDGKILYAGASPLPQTIAVNSDTKTVDAMGGMAVPGLVDSHTHLIHGGSRENEVDMKLKGVSYLDILAQGGGILSTLNATKKASFEELYEKAKKSLMIMQSYGVTTVEAKSGYGLSDFETERRQMLVAKKLDEDLDMDVVSTFMGAHAIPNDYKGRNEDYIRYITDEALPLVKEEGLAEFCDVFCEEGVFSVEESRVILSKAKELGFGLKIHADELVELGGTELAKELGCVSAEHLIKTGSKGIENLSEGHVIADLLPGTCFNLADGHFARGREMLEKGVAVAISTDYNPGSCPNENLQLDMSIAALYMKLRPEEILAAVTINAAAAIRREETIGSLKAGKKADIAIFDVPNLAYMIYHFGINHTSMVIKDGKLVFKRAF